MEWWVWLIVGFCLLGVEIFAPTGFYLFMFGVSAVLVGGLVALDLGGPAWLQWGLFAILAILQMLFLRKHVIKVLKSKEPGTASEIVGAEVVLDGQIPAGGEGRGELRGTTWRVKNAGTAALSAGARIRVNEVNGLTLIVKG